MILITLEIVMLFVGLVAFLTWISHGWVAIAFGLLLSFAIGWGLVSVQLSNELRSLMRKPGTDASVVNITEVYDNPEEHKEFIKLNWMTSNNIQWGWLIWSGFFAFAYGVSIALGRHLGVSHT